MTPVFNDWESFAQLTLEIDRQLDLQNSTSKKLNVHLIAIDDCSQSSHKSSSHNWERLVSINKIEVIRLAVNLGHQRAITAGLCYAEENTRADLIVVMDADGEDSPTDVVRLINLSQLNPEFIIVAERAKRNESAGFKFGYLIYRAAFRVLTGSGLPFGNFALLPRNAITQLVYDSNCWNHFAASILKSKYPLLLVPTNRGKRYFGKSHMNFNSLTLHGLSAMSVMSDRIMVRLIVTVTSITIFFVVAIGAILSEKFNIPFIFLDWILQATMQIILGLIFCLGISCLFAFLVLNDRQNIKFTPKFDSKRFIKKIEIWHQNK